MKRKTVTWATTTIHEFKLGHNACSIPSTGGPSIGLVGPALASRTTQVDDRLSTPRPHNEQLLGPMQRIELLRDAGHSVEEIAHFCIATNQCRTERHETQQEYVAQMRQRHYETYVVRQQIMALEMERQRQFYLQMQQHQHQLQMQSSSSYPRSSTFYSTPYAAASQSPRYQYTSPSPEVQVLDNKRRRVSVEALLN
ncbi:hypothetical protein LEN26_020858 [Aphanomyces euteiches]|nr:hypothetical protein LEN26_020858 [Aphanomyces euteiches]KAH9114417.1 hypothetical protein AeMF1_011498 [Aphanomyces euteiches]KAH9181560.1 hypothetical protein AeNC1_016463 [Aphanomyces euteiches]